MIINPLRPLRLLASFFKYWYFRYMMVTELYMVEPWERYFIHTVLATLFISVFMFNYKILLPTTQLLTVNFT